MNVKRKTRPENDPMICPCCGDAELIAETRNITLTTSAGTIVVPSVYGRYCPACADSIHDTETSRRIMSALNSGRAAASN